MSVFNRDLIVQLLNKLLGKVDLAIGKTDEVLGDTKKILTAVSGGTGAVKSVQRGRCNFYKASQNNESIYYRQINISPVNNQKSIVLINGSIGSTYIRDVFLIDLTSNILRLGSTTWDAEECKNISWQVIEFY